MLRRPSPALVVSMIALVVASTGTAIAAKVLITKPSQVGKNVIRGKHVKNGSLGAQDLSAKGREALRGATGAVGPTGPTGATGASGADGAPGPQGERGPSNAYERTANVVTISATTILNPPSVLTTQTLPAGSYAVTVSLIISNANPGPASVSCTVTGGGSPVTAGWTTVPGKTFVGPDMYAHEQLAMAGSVTLAAAAPLSLNCARDPQGAAVSAFNAHVVAVRVADRVRLAT